MMKAETIRPEGPCIICGSRKVHYQFSIAEFRLEECSNCKLMRLTPQPSDATLAAIYAFLVTPLAIVLGFIIALTVNMVPALLKGPVIFFSLLPMIIVMSYGMLATWWLRSRKPVKEKKP